MSATDRRPAESRVVLITAPDREVGLGLARSLVGERLVACVNLVGGVTSVYRWEGAVEEAGEVLLVVKTVAELLPRLERRLLELHPYDVPELVAFAPEHVEPRYAAWLRDACSSASPTPESDDSPQDGERAPGL